MMACLSGAAIIRNLIIPDLDDVNSSTEPPPNLVLSHEPQSPYYAAVWTMSNWVQLAVNGITATVYQQS